MNEPIFRRPEPGRLFRHLLAASLVAVAPFCGGDARGEDAQTRFGLADESVPSTETIPQAVGREIEAGLFPGVVLLVGRPGRVLYHEAFCQSRIFSPLGMRDTAFGPLRPGPRVVPSGAAEIGQIEDEQARFAGTPVGNAGLFSTAGDLARFCEMMLGAGRFGDVRILSPESHRRMIRNQLGPSLPPRGFGWDMDRQSLHRPRRLSEKAYGHSGRTGQSIWIDPEKRVYVIVLTNRNHPQMVGGQRKTEQYQARARIGDAALEFLESEGQLPKDLP